VQLDLVALETHPRGRQVQPPHLRGALADLGNAVVPMAFQVGAPVAQSQPVVLPQVLGMPHLQAGILQLGDNAPGAGQLTIREYVAVDESLGLVRGVVRWPGDAVVEQPAARAEQLPQLREVRRFR
jgi:hypothetical protein